MIYMFGRLKVIFAAYGPLCIGLPLYALLLWALLAGPDGEDDDLQ